MVEIDYHLHQADDWYVPFGHGVVVLHDLRGWPTDERTAMFDL